MIRASRLKIFADRCAELIGAFNYAGLQAEIEKLDRMLRELPAADRNEDRTAALKASVHARAARCGWSSAEIDALLAIVAPAHIAAIAWQGVGTADGREISRESIRTGMRSAAFSDAGWAKHLASMPKIEAPGEASRDR